MSESRVSKKNSLTTNIDIPVNIIEQVQLNHQKVDCSYIYRLQKLSYKIQKIQKDLQIQSPRISFD